MESQIKSKKALLELNDLKKSRNFAARLKTLDEECRTCSPVTPLVCISSCNVWKQKHELRRLREIMKTPNFMKNLLNTLKNNTRLCALQAIGKGICSVDQLQRELKKMGNVRSQKSIIEQHLHPLLNAGLAYEAHRQYHATEFGVRIAKLMKDSTGTSHLPPRSECHEEIILRMLLSGPKTIEDLTLRFPHQIIPRALKRLKTKALVETSKERDYLFFFKSKRDLSKESLGTTENKVYNCIPDEGISVRKLSEKIDLSTTGTHIYLKKLQGKKLVFKRKTPKTYNLTIKGEKLAQLVNELYSIVEENLSYLGQMTE